MEPCEIVQDSTRSLLSQSVQLFEILQIRLRVVYEYEQYQ